MARGDEAARREGVMRRVEADGSVSVSDLAVDFGVSSVTMRRDLGELERRGIVRRIHGGAVRTAKPDEGSFPFRSRQNLGDKQDIAKRAARLVHNGDSICLDSSSTAHALAAELLELRHLLVVTNSVPTAGLFLDNSAATVFLVGGVLRRSSQSTVVLGLDATFGGSLDLGFFSANGVSADTGLSEISLEEAESKRQLAARCRQIHVLVDPSKFSSVGFHNWLPAARVSSLYSCPEAPSEELVRWRARGTRVDVGSDVLINQD